MKDEYLKLAYDYDEFGKIEDYLGEEQSFFKKIFTENHVTEVLDCACGTGQHLLMLHDLGLMVSGSDYSPSMIDVASENLQSRGVSIPMEICDFRYLEQKFQQTYGAVVCLTNSLPHLHSDEDLIKALTSMKNRLRGDGLLVLTSGITDYTLTLPRIETVVNRQDFSRIFVKEHSTQFLTINILDLFHSEKRLESNQYEIIYRVLLEKDYRRLLSEAGYTEVEVYGDYQMNPYTKKSMRLIVVARK